MVVKSKGILFKMNLIQVKHFIAQLNGVLYCLAFFLWNYASFHQTIIIKLVVMNTRSIECFLPVADHLVLFTVWLTLTTGIIPLQISGGINLLISCLRQEWFCGYTLSKGHKAEPRSCCATHHGCMFPLGKLRMPHADILLIEARLWERSEVGKRHDNPPEKKNTHTHW